MKKGFTLVELIVVITIIAVLTAIGVSSYSGVTKKSRDSRRMADLEKIRVALEMARQVGTSYPASLPTLVTPMGLMTTIPADPKTASGYAYYYNQKTAFTYELWAQMEDTSSYNSVLGVNKCGGTCNYKVANP